MSILIAVEFHVQFVHACRVEKYIQTAYYVDLRKMFTEKIYGYRINRNFLCFTHSGCALIPETLLFWNSQRGWKIGYRAKDIILT